MEVEEQEAIRRELMKVSANGRVGCRKALGVAGRLGVEGRLVGKAAKELGLKIVGCQLGCF